MRKTVLFLFIFINCITQFYSFSQTVSLDRSFGSEGKVLNNFLGNTGGTYSKIILQDDGKIIALGYTCGESLIIRYLSNGTLDPDFGSSGIVVISNTFGRDIALQKDGKIILVGNNLKSNSKNESNRPVVIRFNNNGLLDDSFGDFGIKILTEWGVLLTQFNAPLVKSVLIEANGKIVVGGTILSSFGLVRLNENGTVDTTFGVNGSVRTTFEIKKSLDGLEKIGLTNDGKIIAVGLTSSLPADRSGNTCLAFAKYNQDGTLDESFGEGGMVDFKNEIFMRMVQFGDFMLLADNSFVVVGSKYENRNHPKWIAVVLKFNSSGVLDSSFSDSGFIIKRDGACMGKNIIVDTDNNHLLIGYDTDKFFTGGIPEYNYAVARYSMNGVKDRYFGDQALFAILDNENEHLRLKSIIVQPDNKIVLAGGAKEGGVLTRLNRSTLSTDSFNADIVSCTVYPNPVNETTQLNIELNSDERLTIQLYNTNGNRIKTIVEDKNYAQGHHNEKLDLNALLPKGVYFLKIANKHTSKTIKLIK